MKRYNHHICIGKVRIIGGQWRGRNLPVLISPGLRPTIGRIRETLFDWLGSFIINAKCLDCFAGTGVLGIEALSRYANSATLLEINSNVAQQIRKNLSLLRITNALVITTNALSLFAQTGTPHDIVFIDPPYDKLMLLKTCNLLDQNGWISDGAFIYIENAIKNDLPLVPKKWDLYREKITKKVIYRLYRYKKHNFIYK